MGIAGQSWIVSLGVPGVLFGQGLALIPLNIWAGIGFMTAAVALSCGLIFRAFHRGQATKRWVGVFCTLAVFGITLRIILIPAPMRALIFENPGNYQEGTDVYGIKWKPNYSELGFLLVNDGDMDYIDLDILVGINPGMGFESGGIAPGINQCWLGVEHPGEMFDLKLTSTDKSKPLSIPLLAPTSGSRYRVRCATLASKSRIEVRLAVIAENGQHVEPLWAALSSDFDASFRHRHRFFTQCFKGNCGEIREIPHRR